MLETQQLFVQIDSLRDEMIAEMNYEKSNILQRSINCLFRLNLTFFNLFQLGIIYILFLLE